MRAITLCAGNFTLTDLPIPTPKPGEVRIRIKAAGFNPFDYKARRGDYGPPPPILGADCSGTIDTLGPNVPHFSPGDEVYALAFGQGSNGTYAEYTCVPHQFVSLKPPHLTFPEAAAVPLVALTAYRATHFLPRTRPILIIGAAGGLGPFIAQLLHPAPLYTIARSPDTIHFLTHHLNFNPQNILSSQNLTPDQLRTSLLALNNRRPFFATFDLVGKEMKTLCLSLTAPSGHIISPVPEESSFDPSAWSRHAAPYFQRNLTLHPIFLGAEAFSTNLEDWQVYAEHLAAITRLVEEKKLKVPLCRVVGDLSVETVQEAHRLLESGKTKGKLVMGVGGKK